MRLNEILFPTDFSPASRRPGTSRGRWRAGGRAASTCSTWCPGHRPSLPAEQLARVAGDLADGVNVETRRCSAGGRPEHRGLRAREARGPHRGGNPPPDRDQRRRPRQRGRDGGAPGATPRADRARLAPRERSAAPVAALIVAAVSRARAGVRRGERRADLRGLPDPHPGRGARAEARRRAARPPGAVRYHRPEPREKDRADAAEAHPRGALVFMLIYLLTHGALAQRLPAPVAELGR